MCITLCPYDVPQNSVSASLVIIFDAEGPYLRVVANTSGLKAVFDIHDVVLEFAFSEASRCSYVSWTCFGQESVKGLKVFNRKLFGRVSSKNLFDLMSNLASSSVLVDLLLNVSVRFRSRFSPVL